MSWWMNFPALGRSYQLRQIEYRRGPGPGTAYDLTREFHEDPLLTQQMFDDYDGGFTPSATEADTTGEVVANVVMPFTLRKCVLKFDRDAGTGATDDAAYVGFHLVKLTGGLPDDDWAAVDFTDFETRLNTFWDVMKAFYHSGTVLKQYRWYKLTPGSLLGPPVRVLDKNVPGSAGAYSQLPPQVAISITEKTSDPKSWGRTYWPAPASTILSGANNGRLGTTDTGTIADAADALYQGAITDGTPIVVYSIAKGVRETAGGTELPAIADRALAVTSIQIDDIFDVIRSRRWKSPLLRTQRDVSGA